MHARRTVWLMILLLAWLPLVLAACAGGNGGSGSSGFDSAPTEGAAITLALKEQRCVASPMLTVCPTNVPPPANVHLPLQPGQVDVNVDQSHAVACVQPTVDAACTFTLPFSSAGFSDGTTFRVAVRNVDPPGPWMLSAPPQPTGAPGAPGFEVPVAVGPASGAPMVVTHVQLAVLVFAEPPSTLPASVDELGNTGADFAYVTNELTLQPGM
jgi:hypothetical protein